MKTLLLMRHAKSSWKNPKLADHDRPLNKRGKRDAPRIGELLVKLDLVPDAVVTSTAKRACKTAQLVAENCGFDGKLEATRELYCTDPETWYELIRQISDDNQRVMLVGHNPEMEEFLEMITGQSEAMPTAALAQVDFEIEVWRDFVSETLGKLIDVWRPRVLPF